MAGILDIGVVHLRITLLSITDSDNVHWSRLGRTGFVLEVSELVCNSRRRQFVF